MASNSRPQFKHPIRPAGKPSEDLTWIPAETLLASARPDNGLELVRWSGMSITVRKMIGIDEMQQMVGLILDQCWDGECLRKELADFFLRCAVITFFTNVTLPEKREEQYEILYGTDLFHIVRRTICGDQIASVENALKLYLS